MISRGGTDERASTRAMAVRVAAALHRAGVMFCQTRKTGPLASQTSCASLCGPGKAGAGGSDWKQCELNGC